MAWGLACTRFGGLIKEGKQALARWVALREHALAVSPRKASFGLGGGVWGMQEPSPRYLLLMDIINNATALKDFHMGAFIICHIKQ